MTCFTGKQPAHLLYQQLPSCYFCVPCCAGIVYNITGGQDMTLSEVNRVSHVVTELADPSANVIFGAVVDDR